MIAEPITITRASQNKSKKRDLDTWESDKEIESESI
jgi:hypothetical protein